MDTLKEAITPVAKLFNWNVVAPILEHHNIPLTDEDKFQIIKIKSQENGYHLDDKVINYCLRNLRRDLHTLINTFQALDEWSLKSKRAITINLIKDLQRENII